MLTTIFVIYLVGCVTAFILVNTICRDPVNDALDKIYEQYGWVLAHQVLYRIVFSILAISSWISVYNLLYDTYVNYEDNTEDEKRQDIK